MTGHDTGLGATLDLDELPHAESVCDEGVHDTLRSALGITDDQLDTLTFTLTEIPLDTATVDSLWDRGTWRAELAERRPYLQALADNVDQAPVPILAPNVTCRTRATRPGLVPALLVVDGVHRLNATRWGRGRLHALAWVANVPG